MVKEVEDGGLDARQFIQDQIDKAFEAIDMAVKSNNHVDAAFFRGRYCGLKECLGYAEGGKFFTEKGEFYLQPLTARSKAEKEAE